MEAKEFKTSRYERIAVDIAYSIYKGEWPTGAVIKGRSTLSGKYSVSPETIRRALKLLEEKQVVTVLDKVGLRIGTPEAAEGFILAHQSRNSAMQIRDEVRAMIGEKQRLEEALVEKLDELMDRAFVWRHDHIIAPRECSVPANCPLIGKSIGELKFWAQTGATIVAVERANHLQLSPGPGLVFFEGDRIYFIPSEDDGEERVRRYLRGQP